LTGTTPTATATPTPSASAGPSTVTLADTGSPLDPWLPAGVVLTMLLGVALLLQRSRLAR
jgi:hypothetical protein